MASWLKAAEDLFEVVDRRAKLVVGEKPDEPPASDSSSNRRESQAKRVRPKAKKKLSSKEAPSTVDTVKEQPIPEASQLQTDPDGTFSTHSNENNESNLETPDDKSGNDAQQNAVKDGSNIETPLSGIAPSDSTESALGHLDQEMSSQVDTTTSKFSDDFRKDEHLDVPPHNQSNSVDSVNVDSVVDSNQNIMSEAAIPSDTVEVAVSQPGLTNAPEEAGSQAKDLDLVTEPVTRNNEPPEQQTIISAEKVQEQLDEAQGLLKSAISTGQSKEARLARVCAGLSTRLQEYKAENAQLEELLTAERELGKSYEGRIKQLQKDLSLSKAEVTRVESGMAEALAAKNAEIEALASSVDTLKKQAALAEGNLASIQANMDSIMRNRELTETRMMQALREELAATERRAEEERAAHNAIKLAAREREFELEQRAIEASSSLAKIQRIADDRAAKTAELEQKVALLEVECASLNQELQDTEARVRREQKKSPQDANQAIQVQAWQEEVERARQGQREAESKLSSMEAEVQKMRVEMAAMKRDAEHYSRQEHMELEKRYRELTDLLYYKQTQLETMATEKAAAEFQLEKELKRLHESQLEAERNRSSRRASSSWEEDTDIKALEPLPLHHRHLVGATVQLQKAAKLLDTGAVRATRFLWRYPTARIILLFYLVFVHLFLMYLMHRLQEQADRYTSNEVAESMGLLNGTLP